MYTNMIMTVIRYNIICQYTIECSLHDEHVNILNGIYLISIYLHYVDMLVMYIFLVTRPITNRSIKI